MAVVSQVAYVTHELCQLEWTGSQCSDLRIDVMCFDRRVPVTNRAAAFWTDCNRCSWPSAMPYDRVAVVEAAADKCVDECRVIWQRLNDAATDRQTALASSAVVSRLSITTPRSRTVRSRRKLADSLARIL